MEPVSVLLSLSKYRIRCYNFKKFKHSSSTVLGTTKINTIRFVVFNDIQDEILTMRLRPGGYDKLRVCCKRQCSLLSVLNEIDNYRTPLRLSNGVFRQDNKYILDRYKILRRVSRFGTIFGDMKTRPEYTLYIQYLLVMITIVNFV